MGFDNTDFLCNTEEQFYSCVNDGRKLILFGAGAEMEKSMKHIIGPAQLKADYIVDNDFRKWYSRYFGMQIKEPDCLREEDPEHIVVLITSVYPYRIEKQLKRLGIKYYFSSLLFLEEHIGKYQFMVTF